MNENSANPSARSGSPLVTVIRSLWRPLKQLSLILAISYVGFVVLLIMSETTMVYPAPRFPRGDWDQKRIPVEEVHFIAADGTRLHGWFVEHHDARATVLYFHGNAENVSQQSHLLKDLRDRFQLNVFAFDYRGYGKSEGSPSESGIQLDARAALKWLLERTGTESKEIIFFGRSIGGAVAIELAADKSCKALVLQSAFATLPDLAARHYWWVPVRLLMRNQYPSYQRIRNCPQPLLQTHGVQDQIIPMTSAHKLFAAAISQQKRFVELPGERHNGYPTIDFWNALSRFLDEIVPVSD